MFTGKRISAIFASTQNLGVGRHNRLPWARAQEDMRRFRKITSQTSDPLKQNAVLMGYRTFESMDSKPLPKRLNVVLTSRAEKMKGLETDGLKFAKSMEDAVRLCDESAGVEKVFVMGGGQIYNEFFKSVKQERVQDLYWSLLKLGDRVETDTRLDKKLLHRLISKMRYVNRATMRTKAELWTGESADFDMETYRYSVDPPSAKDLELFPQAHPEQQYLDLLKELRTAQVFSDRTGVGTRQKFGHMFRFDVGESFPLLTTKTVHFHSIVEELLWFLRGSTHNAELQAKGVKIWNGNSSKAFLESRGLPYEEGDLGPIYGFQWRHFGAEYSSYDADYSGKGKDQLRWVIEEMKSNPDSRRLIVSAWNPPHLDQMALPPCHVLFQFNVEAGKLNMSMYQRSADVGLGVPFNIASYAALLCIVADFVGLKRGTLVHFIGCAHIYLNHLDMLEKQQVRAPYPFPELEISPQSPRGFIDEYTAEDIKLKHYLSHETLKMKMAV